MKRLLLSAIALVGVAMGALAQDAINLKGPNGLISAVCHKPQGFIEGTKCPMVVFMHDLSGDKDDATLRQIAVQLEAQGIGTIIFDFSGCGASEGDFKKNTPKSLKKDAAAVIDYVRSLPYVKGVGICGYSIGGIVGILSAADFGKGDVKALALVSPALNIREDIIRGSFLGHKVDKTIELDDKHTLGKDFVSDMKELNFLKEAKGYKGETLILFGKDDTLVPYTYGETLELVMPNAKMEQMKGVDHALASDDVDKRTKAIMAVANFLAKELK